MRQSKQNTRRKLVIIDLDTLVPKDYLFRKIENRMDDKQITSNLVFRL